jgi:hypothetical protein
MVLCRPPGRKVVILVETDEADRRRVRSAPARWKAIGGALDMKRWLIGVTPADRVPWQRCPRGFYRPIA